MALLPKTTKKKTNKKSKKKTKTTKKTCKFSSQEALQPGARGHIIGPPHK